MTTDLGRLYRDHGQAARLTLYGTDWCLPAVRLADFLRLHAIDFDWIDVDESSQADTYMRQLNQGNRTVPTVVFDDGTVMTDPSQESVAAKLGLEIG